MGYRATEENVVKESEYGYLTTKQSKDADSFYLRIPKLMPWIMGGKPKTTPVSINKSIIINDAACKPSVNSKASQQNYILVPRFKNTDYEYKADSIGNIHSGAKFLVNFIEGNILDYHVSDDI